PIVGFAVYRLLLGRLPASGAPRSGRQVAATAFASWVATVVAAAACAGELALSGVVAPGLVLPAMVGVHAVIGLGEASIGALVIASVIRMRPGLVARREGAVAGGGASVVLALVPSVGLALFVSPFACRWPDGLERVVERFGIEPARARLVAAPLGDALGPGTGGAFWRAGLAGVAGVLLVFALSCLLGAWLASSPSPSSASRP
ncbi:MAG TPA: energy-coupling factor ABC transporter permease, partial [Polyangiaceae bacterium]|nr:energy-coupling factor ABC transporter permease [Polyangiaceae bacterium]